MSRKPPAVASAHGTVAALKRHHPGSAEAAEAARNLRAAVLADHIRRVVDEAPPLTPEQLDRLSLLLRPSGGDG